MKDQDTIARFIALRAQGRTLAAIAAELNVSKPTLVEWGRKFQFDIQNLRTVELEALADQHLASRAQRWEQLGGALRRVEAELATRKIEDVPTARLITLAASLRAEAARETGSLRFSQAVRNIPSDEYFENVLDWQS